ncbi:MAG: VWA domain-containing protein [Candidatus Tectomicrobia bacterium]|nr:VWA domain-containing protein [Candidatus Tectomicrobia bacterium]
MFDYLRPFDRRLTDKVIDRGIRIAHINYRVAIEYFKASPHILRTVQQEETLNMILALSLKLVRSNLHVAMEFFQLCPSLLKAIGEEGPIQRALIRGTTLSEGMPSAAVSFLKALSIALPNSPEGIAKEALLEEIAQIGLQLAKKNSYASVIEFFQSCPPLLKYVKSLERLRRVGEIGVRLNMLSPGIASHYFRSSPSILAHVKDDEQFDQVITMGITLFLKDEKISREYFRASSQVLKSLISHEGFSDWFQEGLNLLQRDRQKALAHFTLESRTVRAISSRLNSEVSLGEVARSLRFYAEAHCGQSVSIKSIQELSEEMRGMTRGRAFTDGKTIYLPPSVSDFPDRETNFISYKVRTAHEAGHIEFKSFDLIPEMISFLEGRQIASLADLMNFFASPALARDLFEIVEDGRIDSSIRREYPGMRSEMNTVVQRSFQGRPGIREMSAVEVLVELLTQLTMTGQTREHVPGHLEELLGMAYNAYMKVEKPSASVNDSLEAMAEIYRLFEGNLTPREPGRAAIRQETPYKPMMNFPHRGELSIDLIQPVRSSTLLQSQQQSHQREDQEEKEFRGESVRIRDREPSDKLLDVSVKEAEDKRGDRIFLYHEWDLNIGDYRLDWCRLREESIEPGSHDFVDEALASYPGFISLLKKQFEGLKPQKFKKFKKQEDGDEIDIDRLIELLVDRKAIATPLDRFYTRMDKRERDVAVAFLLDISGSTGMRISHTKRVIDLEREAMVLIMEALHAIGDNYGIFGFSSNGRERSVFYIIKDFNETDSDLIKRRIGNLRPLWQNRDGVAIRHAVRKLEAQEARTKLLILISDGKPSDPRDYCDLHALEDVRMALKEGKLKKIHPFCITIDREAREYIREMYGDVNYTIIDDMKLLPKMVTKIYRRLTT